MEWMFLPLKRYADFSGRSRRMEFWMWQLLQVIVYVVVVVLAMAVGGSAMMMANDPSAMVAAGGGMLIIMLLYMIYWLAVLVPSIAVAVRRLHDTNRTGWWILAPLVPYLVALVAVMGGAASGSQSGLATAGLVSIVCMLAALVLAIVLLVFYFLEGTKGPNRYGPDPKGQDTGQVFA